ncbi:protein fuzzy homolog [Octopus bimaculoides]|uniref:protein fuzzy homolog n=1 Tax=Octopus bimaculoides TaxID=37653 RepID=UPI0022E48E33|nr:protein fuzzy homolog [Octopus bimaculoides]
MAACSLMCLTTCGGVPLFTRNKGTKRPLPFPLIGTLNGVQMFAASRDMELQSTTTENSKVFWKVFQNSITLILITDDYSISDCHIGNFLRIIFNVVVFFCGQEDVANIKNPERFKNEIKVCFKLIDDLMNQMSSATFSAMTNTVEIITGPDCIPLQCHTAV